MATTDIDDVEQYPRIRDTYVNKVIFITGASGFIGKVLIEKLLRSCPDIKKIYLLLRPKKGLTIKERLDGIISSEVRLSNLIYYLITICSFK